MIHYEGSFFDPMGAKRSEEEITRDLSKCAAIVKLVCGVANNAAWMVVLDAYGHAKRCRRFRASVRGGRVSWYFKRAIDQYHQYERRLLHASVNRMFCLEDMDEEVRRKYGDISDRQFYEFWASIGGVAYTKTKPQLNSLWNKYRVSLIRNGVADAEHVAWVMVAMAALEIASQMYEGAIRECMDGFRFPRYAMDAVFGQFSLEEMRKSWRRALMMLSPDSESVVPDNVDERNIEHGLLQLLEAWSEPDLLYSSTLTSVEDYEEIFRTKGFQKKCMREIAGYQDRTEREMKSEK